MAASVVLTSTQLAELAQLTAHLRILTRASELDAARATSLATMRAKLTNAELARIQHIAADNDQLAKLVQLTAQSKALLPTICAILAARAAELGAPRAKRAKRATWLAGKIAKTRAERAERAAARAAARAASTASG